MRIMEFGPENGQQVMLIHGEHARWDIFLPAMEPLVKTCRVLIPVLDGFDAEAEKQADFPGVEKAADQLCQWLEEHGKTHLLGVYGISLGGSIAFQMLSREQLSVDRCVMEGAIMPSDRMKAAVRAQILVKEGLTSFQKRLPGTVMARLASAGPSTMEELLKTHELMRSLSRETMRQINRSCLCAPIPKALPAVRESALYMYAQGESQDRYQDIQFLHRRFPEIPVLVLSGLCHAELLFKHPDIFGDYLSRLFMEDGYMPQRKEKAHEDCGPDLAEG